MAQSQSLEIEAMIFIIILIMYVLTSHLIQIRNIPYLHQSSVAIFMGLLTGVFAKYAFDQEFSFSSQFFFTIILPPIIFSAGYSLRKSLFFQNFNIIGYLGIAGTIIGFILLSLILYAINSWIFKILTLGEVLMLAAILSATDTVAAISLIKAEKYPILNAVLFGQGIINDAVSIILFRTVERLKLDEDGSFSFGTVVEMIFNFLYLLVFSLLLGMVSSLGLSYFLKINESFLKFPIKQTSLILLNGYLTYLIGQILGLSGIISLFTSAIIMGHYCFRNISEESQKGTGLAFETVSYVAEAFVYAYLGASIVSLNGTWLVFGMALLALLFLPVVRGAIVYLLPGIYRLIKKNFPLESKELKICWFSGMIRGVIAFALSLQIEGPNSDSIRQITMTIALITTIGGSSTLRKFAEFVGFKNDGDEPLDSNANRMLSQKLNASEKLTNYHKVGLGFDDEPSSEERVEKISKTKKLEELESKYIKPIFQKKNYGFNYELSESSHKNDSS